MTAQENTPFPLVLIGPMAAGKTRIGKLVARALDAPFIDTDQRVVAAYGSIDEIFAREGEEYFRVVEREAVAEALGTEAVVSLGGGAVLHPDTRAELAGCTVVYLSVDATAVKARIGDARKRPLLQAGIEDWQRIYDARRPMYEALAGIRIDTSERPVAAIADDIVSWISLKATPA
jgi:shikimate kinase